MATTRENPEGGGEASDGNRPRCKGCGAESPQTNTNYTLISQQHGWRLAFEYEADGRRVAHWRCPKCWDRHRKAKQR
jgi:YD repeat-containing protein